MNTYIYKIYINIILKQIKLITFKKMSNFQQFNEEDIDGNIDINPNQQPLPQLNDQIQSPAKPGMVINNSESNITEEISSNTMNTINNYLGFIGKYFNVEINDVVNKLKGAIIPFNKSFYQTAEASPDLYGPFWIYTTIIFVITVTANVSGYLHTKEGETFQYNYDFIPHAMLFMYGFGFGAPVILFFLCKFVFKVEFGLISNICIYGYSFTVLIPILFLCILPFNWIETLLLIYFICHSGIFLFYNMWLLLSEKAPKAKYPILGVIGGIQVLSFFLLKFYFFAEANMKKE